MDSEVILRFGEVFASLKRRERFHGCKSVELQIMMNASFKIAIALSALAHSLVLAPMHWAKTSDAPKPLKTAIIEYIKIKERQDKS
jgi:hypothetical protein